VGREATETVTAAHLTSVTRGGWEIHVEAAKLLRHAHAE
jgi:hypothetical protein